MRYIDVKRSVSHKVDCYMNGIYSVSECLKMIDNEILYNINSSTEPDTDIRISKQNKLYKYGLDKLSKAIAKMERLYASRT